MTNPWSLRPWGLLQWLLPKLSPTKWSVIGAISPGHRSLTCWRLLKTNDMLEKGTLLRIQDEDDRFRDQTEARLTERCAEFLANGGATGDIRDCHLMDYYDKISDEVLAFAELAGPSIILDITALPKRFFFPMLRDLLRDSRVSHLLATYTVPKRYTARPLAENFNTWSPLPTFREVSRDWRPDMMIVNVGFLAMGLPEHLNPEETGDSLKFLLPFPTPPPDNLRNWEVLQKLDDQSRVRSRVEIIPVHSRDVPDAYDLIASLGEGGSKRVILAPYGPKPISLAMCLYASRFKQPVYYTQPRAYHPDYSIEVSTVNGHPEVYGYCIKLAGRTLYA